MALPGMMGSPDTGSLDGPPPSPQMGGAGPTGQSTPMSMAAMAPAPISSGQLPPEMLTGILQSSQRIAELLDAYAQAAPDLAMEFELIKTSLATTLAKLVERGAQPTSPTAAGPAFPGGGMDRGVPGGGAI